MAREVGIRTVGPDGEFIGPGEEVALALIEETTFEAIAMPAMPDLGAQFDGEARLLANLPHGRVHVSFAFLQAASRGDPEDPGLTALLRPEQQDAGLLVQEEHASGLARLGGLIHVVAGVPCSSAFPHHGHPDPELAQVR